MNSSCQILLVELVRSCFLLLPTTEPVLDQAHEADCSARLNGVKTEVERQIRVLWRNVSLNESPCPNQKLRSRLGSWARPNAL